MSRILRECRETSSLNAPHEVDKSAHAPVVLDSGPVFQRAASVYRVGTHLVDSFFNIFRRQATGEVELRDDVGYLLCNRPVKYPASATAQTIVSRVEHDRIDL